MLLDNNGLDNDFEQEEQDEPGFPRQFLWREQGDDEFMLNVDVALAIDVEGSIVAGSGEVTCSPCPDSRLLPRALQYADSNQLWVNDFHDAFQKICNAGCGGAVCTAV